jgi:glycerophosphoryl diester phosphodiesterase
VIAHRAGNRLDTLHAAALAGARLVEADVRLFRRRLELRHLKTVGPVPLYWDRGELTRGWRRVVLADLLAAPATPELMLDLKGPRRRLGELVAEALEPVAGSRRLTVCARSWALLEPFETLPVRRVHSVGSLRELRRLRRRFAGRRLDGVSIHERLLSPSVAAHLRELTATVLSWPVNDLHRARELVELGVAGLISDRPELLAGAGALR